jgi:hypothetical protein
MAMNTRRRKPDFAQKSINRSTSIRRRGRAATFKTSAPSRFAFRANPDNTVLDGVFPKSWALTTTKRPRLWASNST